MGPLRVSLIAVFFAICFLALPAAPSLSHPNARFFRGEIVASTEWSGVIRLTGTVVIREEVTVTVEPGTEILVQPAVGAAIVVRGRLLVRGVQAKPVLFDSAGGCSDGSWEGILFESGSTGVLENTVLRCAVHAIKGDTTGVTRVGVSVDPWK